MLQALQSEVGSESTTQERGGSTGPTYVLEKKLKISCRDWLSCATGSLFVSCLGFLVLGEKGEGRGVGSFTTKKRGGGWEVMG